MMPEASAISVGDTARILVERGFSPVLLRPGTKRPVHDAWEQMTYDHENLPEFYRPGMGIGLQWGKGYIDVDLENQLVADLGKELLPPTSMVWGRTDLSSSHRVYKVDAPDYRTLKIKSHDRTLYAEVRNRNSQSVIPPSRHPETGGQYMWNGSVESNTETRLTEAVESIPGIEAAELETSVKEVVFTAVMAELWPNMAGNRHDAMMGICGLLLKTGRAPERVYQVARCIVEYGHDPDPQDRLQIPSSSNMRLEAGEDVAGYMLLSSTLGEEIAKWASRLFHIAIERVESVNGFTLNDMGNSELFVRMFGSDLMWLGKKKDWCSWNGTHWELINTFNLEQTKAKLTVKHMEQLAPSLLTATERGAMRQHALESGSRNAISAMIALSRDNLAIDESILDRDPWLFNVANGTLDLRTGELKPHRKEDFITRMGGCEYDPKAECPMWQGFLKTIFAGDGELIRFMKLMAGYAMTGSIGEQCMFFFYGHGKNGKTTFIETMMLLFGSYALKTPSETVIKKRGDAGIPNDIARLRGARFVAAKEVESGTRLAENVVKDLTGGDTVTARFLHGEWFDFSPVLKLVMYGNHKPTIYGQDEGIWRRIRLVPFTQVITAKIDEYWKLLFREEGPGILRWCLEGCLEWQRDGLVIPGAVEEATQEYRGEMDQFGDFVSQYYQDEPRGKVNLDSIYARYTGWCMSNGEKAVTQKHLTMKLVEKGYGKAKSNGKWCITGLSEIPADITAHPRFQAT